MEHHSNIVPWYLLAQRTGAVLDWVGIDDQGRLDREAMSAALAKEPKLLAFTHVSNVLGTVNDVASISAEAKAAGATCRDRRCPVGPANSRSTWPRSALTSTA